MAHFVLPCFRRMAQWGQQEVERARNCWQATITTNYRRLSPKLPPLLLPLISLTGYSPRRKEIQHHQNSKFHHNILFVKNSTKFNTILQKKRANLTLNEGKWTLVRACLMPNPTKPTNFPRSCRRWWGAESASLKMSSGPIFTEQIDQLVLKLVSQESESDW